MRDRLDEDCIRFVEANGIRTRVYEAGEGEPLVLVHGGGFGSLYSLDEWSIVLPALEERFRVVAFDKLGQGHTDNPRSDAEYTFEGLLAHTLALLDGLALGPAHFVGHSMGAFLAARVGVERPDLLRSLVLVDTNTTAPDDPRYPWTAFYRELEQKTPPGPPTRDTVRLEPVAQSWSDAHVTDDFVERLYAIAQRPECGEAAARVKELREATWMPSILGARARNLEEIDERGLPVPTLIVWGADDPSAPLPLALALFDRIAARTEEVELHVLSHAGHYCFRERPQAFLRLVTGFCGDR